MRIAALPRSVELAALAAFVTAATALLIGDFGVRLAASTADDSPALLARFLVDPQAFQGDVLESFGAVYGLGTVVHWGPALLFHWLNVSPETSALVLAYLQNVLLAVAVWVLASAAGAQRALAWSAALFTLAAEVYLWNLANYRSQMQVPYAGHMVLPLVTFAAAALLARRDFSATLVLIVAALVHPTVTLLVMPPFAYVLLTRTSGLRGDANGTPPILHASLVLLPSFLAAVGVALFVRAVAPPGLDAAEMLEAMRANVHMNPLGTARFTRILLPAYASFLLLLVIALQQRTLPLPYRSLLLATTAAAAVYAFAHMFALRAGLTLVITLVPLRFTMVLALFAIPAIVAMLIDALRTDAFAERWAAAALLVLLPLSALGVYWPALVALLLLATLHTGKSQARSIVHNVALGLLIAWIGAVLASSLGRPLPPALAGIVSALTAGSAQSALTLLGGITVAGLLALLLRSQPQRERAAIIVAALCAVLLVVRNAAKGADTRGSQDRDLYAAQLWAHQESPADAVFIVEPNVPWRVVSGRRALPLWPNDAHVYTGSRAAFVYTRDVRTHVTRAPLTDAAAITAFRARFGGDYLVREAARTTPYPAAYRNEHFAIYRLPAWDSVKP